MPEERLAQHVVTSENREEFMAKRLDLAKPEPIVAPETVKAEEKKPEVKAEEKPEPAEEDEEVKEVRKRNPKLEQRFSELTKQREEAKRQAAEKDAEAKREREGREKAERETAELRVKLNPPPKDDLGPEPKRDQFESEEEFFKARLDYSVDAKLRERDKQEAEIRAKSAREQIVNTWNERQAEARKEIADYEETIAKSTVVVSNEVRDAIVESPVGTKLLYHFAKNPQEAERIGKLSIGRALVELGKIESKLSGEPAKPAPKSEPVAEISKAAPPIAPLKGAAAAVESPIDADGKFHGTYAQWKDARKAGKIK